ncbi:MAG TPA: type II toxin-antitoxin system VapC family toxin [Terracidiphilus sp.]|nr:type II toxin-antitoxin system VapC family toxin [Terracidiphilus sp.]
MDSSLLVSLYVKDSNSPQALQRMSTRPDVWVTPLNRSELAHAVNRYVFREKLSEFEAHRALKAFEDDCANGTWSLANFPAAVWDRSIDLARRHGPRLGMRTLDSLHVACALELNAERFWTFDERQARLAEAAGLDTRS